MTKARAPRKRRRAATSRAPMKRRTTAKTRPASGAADVAGMAIEELETLRAEIDQMASPPRWNADPEDVRRSVGKLVLTLVEFIRQLLERQAIRRMDAGTLTPEQTEAIGLALMRLEETIRDLAVRFGVDPADLNLDLGPVGKLM
jgi:hypothetical protein